VNQLLINQLIEAYQAHFGTIGTPMLVFAPGRINVLGEHVDYNDGIMLPAAIDKGIYLLVVPRTDRQAVIRSLEFNESVVIDLDKPMAKSSVAWANYLIGVMAQFEKLKLTIPGFNLVFAGDLPIGAGMSSSAAVETGMAYVLNQLTKANLPTKQLVLMAQKAEHEYAGVLCGVMDQFASMMGQKNKVVMFDSISLEHEYLSADLGDYRFVLLDSKVKHSLASSAYNTRRQESAKVLQTIQAAYPNVQNCRDATLDQLTSVKDQLDEVHLRRGKFVIEEIGRVKSAKMAFNSGNWMQLGALMNATHTGLSKEYEVSCTEMDYLWELAQQEPAILGARMMGGGFGGCTINLMRADQANAITARILKTYYEKFGIEGDTYTVSISDGTHQLILD
jgi:galactokinase